MFNAGSSTLKASLIDQGAITPRRSATETWSWRGTERPDVEATVQRLLDALAVDQATIHGVGHRIVHGGDVFSVPIVLDEASIEAISRLSPLAPLHEPIAVATIRAARVRIGSVPHIGCFDTAFHATLPEIARRYPVPDAWAAWGIRRYGFHGLSIEWAAGRAAILLDRPAARTRLVVAHLGSGCSVTAVDGGRSVWTSMGLTPLEGTMMATRAGSLDPGILVRLLREGRLSLDALDEALERRSGLLGVGGTADMQILLEREAAGDERATLAVAMFVDRTAAAIGSAMTRLESLDAVVFTGGIGENSASIRARICRRLGVVGVPPVPARHIGRDAIVSGRERRPRVIRIAAHEDVVVARAVERRTGVNPV